MNANPVNTQITIVPTLTVKNASAAIAFYRNAFGAVVLMSNEDPDGGVVAEMEMSGARFVVADESSEHGNLGPQTLGGTPVRIGLQVADPDAFFKRVLQAGGKEIHPVEDQDYGYRLGHLTDPFGHHWEIFKPL